MSSLAQVHFAIAIAGAIRALDPGDRQAFLLHLDAELGRLVGGSLGGPAHADTRADLHALWADLEDAIALLDAYAAQGARDPME